ncbi:TetR/AcrR family transcriptional regulator [Aquipuribacter sp. SD81]|uniref:TetR/AcrR family transcriptional regulator n=1 Tax=Aquipuribacter sp. SD81 TaxID=3127703 RepID=UPI0030160B07
MAGTVNSADRRRAIVAAVYRVLERDGLEGATMRRIAAEAGCTTGSVTHHFADRRELLDATVGAAVEESMARLVATTRREGLRAGLAEMLPLDGHRRQELAVWLVGVQAAARDPELAARLSLRYAAAQDVLVAELHARLSDRADAGAQDAEALDLLADEVLSAVDGVAVYAVSDPARYPPERQLALVDRVLRRTGLA